MGNIQNLKRGNPATQFKKRAECGREWQKGWFKEWREPQKEKII